MERSLELSRYAYQQYAKSLARPSPLGRDLLWAFFTGGGICLLGQGLGDLFLLGGVEREEAAALVSMSLIFLTALLTGLGVFDKLARRAGAGTLVPITGFANAMVSPALEFRREGRIVGVGSKLFTVAGPVLVGGISASVLYGLLLWLFS